MATLSGTVATSLGAYVQRLVRAYRRDNGAFVGETFSNAGTGAFSITTSYTGEHFVLAHDIGTLGDSYYNSLTFASHFNGVADNSDAYRNNVVLNLRMNGTNGSTTIIDDTGKTVTAYGNASLSTTQVKYGSTACYFDGSGDRLATPITQDFNMGSGDFTLELWYYPVSAVASDRVFQTRDGDVVPGIYLSHSSATALQFYQSVNGSGFYGAGITFNVTQNTWQHIAIVKSSGTVKAYVNGTYTGTSYAVVGAMYYSASDTVIIGGQTSGRTTNGYIDDLRLTKGVARYTTNFTAPTAELPTSAPRFVDTINNAAMTAFGDATISLTQAKFGAASAYFDGTGDYVTFPDAAGFDFGSGDFAIDFWVYPTVVSGTYTLITKRAASTNYAPFVAYIAAGKLQVNISLTGSTWVTNTSAATVFTANTWHHVAVVRNGANVYGYVGGTLATTNAVGASALMTNTAAVALGGDTNTNYYAGYIDDLRITKGFARYTGAFSPPTSAFPDGGVTGGAENALVFDRVVPV